MAYTKADSDTDNVTSYVWRPKGCDQQGRYPEAAHAASELDDAEPPQTLTDRIVDWLTPARFWKLYGCAIFGAILLVWWLA